MKIWATPLKLGTMNEIFACDRAELLSYILEAYKDLGEPDYSFVITALDIARYSEIGPKLENRASRFRKTQSLTPMYVSH